MSCTWRRASSRWARPPRSSPPSGCPRSTPLRWRWLGTAAAGAIVAGLSPVVGLLAFTLGSGAAIGALGNRLRGRDVTIGIVLAWTLGLGVLFISLYRGYATEAYALLFGEILGISERDVLVTLIAGVVTLVAL